MASERAGVSDRAGLLTAAKGWPGPWLSLEHGRPASLSCSLLRCDALACPQSRMGTGITRHRPHACLSSCVCAEPCV
jgi:hypothetical protein